MMSRSGDRRHDPRPFVLVAAGLAAVSTFLSTSRGIGLTPDSANYFAAGGNLVDGLGLTTFDGTPLTMFPPGIPFLVAAGRLVHLDPATTLRIVNVVLAAAVVAIGYLLTTHYLRRGRAQLLVVVLLTINVALLDLFKMALSEGMFVVVCVAFIAAAERFVSLDAEERRRPDPIVDETVTDSASSWRRYESPLLIALLVLLASAAFAVRYVGIILVPLCVVTVVYTRKHRSLHWYATRTIGLLLVLSVVPSLIMLRNHRADGTLLGPRSPSSDGLVGTVARFIAILGKWLLPDPTPVPVQAVAGLLFAVAIGYTIIRLVLERGLGESLRMSFGRPAILFTCVYSAYIVYAQVTVSFDRLNSRLLAPLVVPLIVLTTTVGDRIVDRVAVRVSARRHGLLVTRASVAVLTALVLYQTVTYMADVFTSGRLGVEYASDQWRNSELFERARSLDSSTPLYSNVPAGAWLLLDRQPIRQSPAKRARRSTVELTMDEEFLVEIACNNGYLVWSDLGQSSHLFSPEELGEHVRVRPVTRATDGTIFRLSPLDDEDGTDC